MVVRDLSERREQELTLRSLEQMVNSIADYEVIRFDLDGLIRSWNQGAQTLTGYTADEVVGHKVSMFYTAEDARSDMLEREKARAADAERRKRERTARAEQSGQTPERVAQHRAGVGTRPKPELRASALSTPVTSRWAGLPRSETQVDFIRRKQAERELPLMQPTLIVTPTMQRTIWPEGDGYDRQDIEQLAIHLHEDLGCPSADILNALLAAKPGVSYLATATPDFRLVPIEPDQ
jgi:PAS domain S-box-containing protein